MQYFRFPHVPKSENSIDLPCNVKKLLKRITISNSTECFPSPKVPLVSTRNLVVRDSDVFAKPLMEKGGVDIWCVADHKIPSLRSFLQVKAIATIISSYCSSLESLRWKMSSSQSPGET